MNRSCIYKLFICLFLTFVSIVAPVCAMARTSAADDTDGNAETVNQLQFAAIVVNGRTLTGPNSSAHRLGGRISIPISSVARVLGDILKFDGASRSLSVRRSTGVLAEFDARLGQVRENGAAILTVSNTGEIIFPPSAEDFLLPVEIAASLFDVSIHYESGKNLVVIVRGVPAAALGQSKVNRGPVQIHRVDYEYNLNHYSTATAHSLVLLGTGRLADGRFTFASNATGGSRGVAIQRATFNLERPNGQLFSAGDLGTRSNLQFLSSNVRGASASIPVGDVVVTAFGGRTFSGVLMPAVENHIGIRRLPRYDMNTFGTAITTTSRLAGGGSHSISAGAMRFNSANRTGTFATGNVSYDSARFRFQSDIGYGVFDGHGPSKKPVAGRGAAVDLAGTFHVRENLAVQGRYTNISRNFLSPQSGVREALNLKAVGLTWSPVKWLSTSVNGSTSRRPNDTKDDNFVTAAVAITPSNRMPRFFFSHTQGSSSQIPTAAFTTLTGSKDFSRLRLYANATRIKNLGPASVTAQFGANFSVNDTNSIEFSQGLGNRRSYNGQFDWRTSNLFKQRLGFSAGAGYNYAPTSGFSQYQRLAASLKMPRQTSLQVNYYNTKQGPTVLMSLRGTLFRKRETQAFLESAVSELNSYGKVSGRVYQDTNLNGRFDEGVDKPQADVKVRVDGNRYVVSDANGIYLFESITAGDHKVYLDLLSVRADLTLLSDAAQDTKLIAGHESKYDFRLVRTGRISGRVWLDSNENGTFDKGETPLPDIRVVTASGRDTLTDSDGNFTIADLAPGEHTLFIDEKTLPEKMTPGKKPVAVQAFAGRETTDIFLTVIPTPAEIKRFSSKQN